MRTGYLIRNDVKNSLARAYLTADQIIPHYNDTKVSGYTEVWDIGSNFASDKYVAPVNGYYHVSFSILFYDAESKLTGCQSRIYLNDGQVIRGVHWEGTDKVMIGCSGSDDIYMAAGQYIELWGFCTTSDASDAKMYGGSPYTFMSVHLISRA